MKILDARNEERASPAEGTGGSSGIVLNMDMVSTGYSSVAYTVPVQVGSSQQNVSLQVDTGSSDLWIASTSCSSSSCSATNGRLYNPSSSQPTGATFNMQYLSGTVSGRIVWDQVQIGDYVIGNQALAAATTVTDEPLSYSFDGILGLALPSNSLIQQTIPASTGDSPDGATFPSNLFSLTPAADAPLQPFFSLTLARPGFGQLPSLLGIGRHPPEIVPDPSQIRYSPVVSENVEALFWKTTVRAITVYVQGQAHPVALQSLSGAPEPTALLDSGVPLIIATPALANGIYGALGIGPASDGNYYVPCATPLNITITLDGQNEIPLHPLDLTVEPQGQSSSQYCTGLVQTDPLQLTAASGIGDMILGVPFLRNVYTVMAYEQPDASGNFNTSVALGTNPTLGLLGLTNATQAMQEFNQARVSNQPLGPPQNANAHDDGPKLSVGTKILIGLVGFFVLLVALFGLRCLLARRRWRRSSPAGQAEQGPHPNAKTEYGAYDGASNVNQHTPLYAPMTKVFSRYTASSGRTCVESEGEEDEFGVRTSKLKEVDVDAWDPWDPYAGTWRDTIVGTDAGSADYSPRSPCFPAASDLLLEHGPDSPSMDLASALLTSHDREDQGDGMDEFGVHPGMAGIGTAARGSVIDMAFHHRLPSVDSVTPLRPIASLSRTLPAPCEHVDEML